jgi:hypothetical protein
MYPLDRCVNSTRRTLGLVDIRCFSRGLVKPLNYPFSFLMLSQVPKQQKSSLVSVFCEFFGASGEEVHEVSLQEGNFV